jgi:hypothetical protein
VKKLIGLALELAPLQVALQVIESLRLASTAPPAAQYENDEAADVRPLKQPATTTTRRKDPRFLFCLVHWEPNSPGLKSSSSRLRCLEFPLDVSRDLPVIALPRLRVSVINPFVPSFRPWRDFSQPSILIGFSFVESSDVAITGPCAL